MGITTLPFKTRSSFRSKGIKDTIGVFLKSCYYFQDIQKLINSLRVLQRLPFLSIYYYSVS